MWNVFKTYIRILNRREEAILRCCQHISEYFSTCHCLAFCWILSQKMIIIIGFRNTLDGYIVLKPIEKVQRKTKFKLSMRFKFRFLCWQKTIRRFFFVSINRFYMVHSNKKFYFVSFLLFFFLHMNQNIDFTYVRQNSKTECLHISWIIKKKTH